MKNLEEFSRRMHISWDFRDQRSKYFSDQPEFCLESNWRYPPVHPGSKLSLSHVEKKSLMTF